MVLFGGLWSWRHSQNDDYSERVDDDDDDDRHHAQWRTTNNHNNGAVRWDDLNAPSLTGRLDDHTRETLRMCVVYTVSYLGLAVVAYSYIFEHWSVIDSLYFAVSTFTTVGYGDVEPKSESSQLFTIVFAVYGVIILGIFIGVVGHSIAEKRAAATHRWKRSQKRRLLHSLFPEYRPPSYPSERDPLVQRRHSWWSDHASLLDDVWKVCKVEAPEILLVMLLALILGLREGWSMTSTFYFCIMSASTTGYGDYVPKTNADKIYCIFFLPLSVAVFGEVLGRIATLYITQRNRELEYSHLHRTVTLCDLKNMDANGDGMVDREEFIIFLLVALQKVDQELIDELKAIFAALDRNGNGKLEKDDLVALNERPTWTDLQRRVSRRNIE